jgi:hypothetical protein
VVLREIADRLPEYQNEGPDDPTLDGRTIKTKATPDQVEAAAARMAQAAGIAGEALVEEDPCKSAVLWRNLRLRSGCPWMLSRRCATSWTARPMTS